MPPPPPPHLVTAELLLLLLLLIRVPRLQIWPLVLLLQLPVSHYFNYCCEHQTNRTQLLHDRCYLQVLRRLLQDRYYDHSYTTLTTASTPPRLLVHGRHHHLHLYHHRRRHQHCHRLFLHHAYRSCTRQPGKASSAAALSAHRLQVTMLEKVVGLGLKLLRAHALQGILSLLAFGFTGAGGRLVA